MASPNITMRDPVIYRIKRSPHYRTESEWVVYPMYDFAHCLSDSLENIIYSICTLEFENNRPLYDWIVDALIPEPQPRQIEFARLNLSYTILSKRRLIELVEKKDVSGWDDPRMPTIAGMRRRGYTPEAIRTFCAKIGVAKKDNLIDMSLLESCVRDDLNDRAPRAMAVLRPLKLVIDNYPDDRVEEFDCANHPQKPEFGSRKVPFSKVLYIEGDDFSEEPPKKYKRLSPGREVRLRYAYVIKYASVVKDETGRIMEVHCTYDPDTRDSAPPDGRKVEGVIHWVSAGQSVTALARLYDRLFQVPNAASEGDDFAAHLNPSSLETLIDCRVEASLGAASGGSRFQFERLGYFSADPVDSIPGKPVFNRIVTLRDSWAKVVTKAK
jgi:glutaminyl-tRNA synthetase